MKYARNSHGEARAPVNTLDRLIETPGDFHVTRGSSAAAYESKFAGVLCLI